MRSSLAPLLLKLSGLTHIGALIVLSLLGTRPLTLGDIAFLIGVGALYFGAARAMTKQRRWGRWLGLVVSGVEAFPGMIFLYIVVIFSADAANESTLSQFGFLALLLIPLIVFIALLRHRPEETL